MLKSSLKLLLTLVSLVNVALCFDATTCQAALYLEEAFDFGADGNNLGGNDGWTGTSANLKIKTNSLSYSGLTNISPAGNMVALLASGGASAKAFTNGVIAPVSSGSIYLSLLVQVGEIPGTSATAVAGLEDDSSVNSSGLSTPLAVAIKQITSSSCQFGIVKGQGGGVSAVFTNANGVGTPVIGTNTVNLIVAKYDFSTTPDIVTLWVNPASLGGAEDSNPSISATNTGNNTDAASISYIFLRAGSSGILTNDTMRVGSTWADVTPSGGSTPPAATNAPVITQTLFNGNAVILRGTNGTASGVYQVLSSTNITVPRPSWPSIATNLFDAGGIFDCTNPVAPSDVLRYYTLLVGGSLPPQPQGPAITTQPTNRTAAVGQSTSFTVVATGDPTLYYQWYFNTNSLLSDKTNALLSLPSVTTNDAGYYSVVVSNNVNSVVSTQALLTVLVPPSITADPTNLTVLAGSNATFSATATGTSPLAYQWFFNTNTALASATNASLLITNAQSVNEGKYSLRVTNIAGSITSLVATLTVNSKPSITNEPQDLSITISNNATFTVTAIGTAPLRYQWYFNTNTQMVNATNVSLTITNAQLTNAGKYSVIVTNFYGSITSRVATLTVNSNSGAPDFSMIGFATLSGFTSNDTYQAGGTTGGGNGPIVLATNVTSFVNFVEKSNMSLKVLVTTDLDFSVLSNHHGSFPADYPTGEILVNSNKTIYSTNGATLSRGTLRIGKASNGKQNIIIRNLKFRDLWVYDPSGNYDTYGWDYIGLEGGSHHVWVDHCDFDHVYDGMLDVTHASDYLTASWNIFRTQKKCSLIGHSDSNASEDTGHLNVTFHHNYYVDVEERMPRMRFGNAHVFNLYCENLGGNGIQSTADAATLVENVYFYHPASGSLPTREENGGPTGIVKVVNSTIVNLTNVNVQFRQNGQATFTFNSPFATNQPPYPYTQALTPTADVPNIVTNWAGVGKVTVLP